MESISHTVEYTIILPEFLSDKLKEFQDYALSAFHIKWDMGKTMTLLLRYSIKDFDNIPGYHLEILKSYFEQKMDLVDEFYLNIIRSSHTCRNLCTA